MSNFHVGQKVCCIRDEWPAATERGYATPKKGPVYTVRKVYTYDGKVGVLLAEIVNPPIPTTYGVMEVAFNAEGFRPVVERKTDISCFKAMLNPKKIEVTA